MRKTRVYVAGPITGSGSLVENVRVAELTGARLREAGYTAYVPHRDLLTQLVTGESDYEAWMEDDYEWLGVCDVLLRLPGVSPGADREVQWAQERGIPVYHDRSQLYDAVDPTQPASRSETRRVSTSWDTTLGSKP